MKRPMLISGAVAVVATALFLLFGQNALLWVAVLGVSVAAFSLIFKKRLKKFYAFLFIGICFASVAFANFIFYYIHEAPAKEFSDSSHNVIAYVCELPEEVNSEYTEYTFKAERSDGEKCRLRFTFFAKSGSYKLYDTVSFKTAVFSYFDGNLNEKAYTEKVFLTLSESASEDLLFKKSPTPYYYCLRFKEKCISVMKEKLSFDSAALLSGMVFGEKSDLSNSLRNAFKVCGVSHILAVSGLHVSLWCGILAALLRLLGLSEKTKNAISVVFLIFLCTVSAFTPSVIRASFMSGLTFAAPFFRRRPDALNSLGFAVTLILILNPYILLNPSFVLSALATAGVLFSSFAEGLIKRPKLKGKFKNKVYDFFASGALVSVCSSLFTLPACAYFFKSFSLIAPFANIFVVEPSFYAMLSGMVLTLLSFLPFSFADGIFKALFLIPEFILKFISLAVRLISEIPYACVPANMLTAAGMLLSVVAGLFVYFTLGKNAKRFRVLRRFSYIFFALVFCFSGFLYLLPVKANRKLTVISSSGYPVAAVRCGGEYALFGVPKSKSSLGETKNYLPQTSEQALTHFVIMYKTVNSDSFTEIEHGYFPENTVAVSGALSAATELCAKIGAKMPVYTDKFTVNKKIYAEIVDTYGNNYVIIASDDTGVAVSFSDYNDVSLLGKKFETLVICENQAKEFNSFCKTLVVCSYEGLPRKTKETLEHYCEKLVVLVDGEAVTVTL